ncbi:hypothetical protein AAHB56_22245, partial [Bacillus thuringiensis]
TKVTKVIMVIITTKVIMVTTTTKATMVTITIKDINNKYITTDTIIYIHRLFFIKLIKVTKVIMATKVTKVIMVITTTKVTKVIMANTVTKASTVTKVIKVTTNNINNNNLLLGPVELEQEQQG